MPATAWSQSLPVLKQSARPPQTWERKIPCRLLHSHKHSPKHCPLHVSAAETLPCAHSYTGHTRSKKGCRVGVRWWAGVRPHKPMVSKGSVISMRGCVDGVRLTLPSVCTFSYRPASSRKGSGSSTDCICICIPLVFCFWHSSFRPVPTA